MSADGRRGSNRSTSGSIVLRCNLGLSTTDFWGRERRLCYNAETINYTVSRGHGILERIDRPDYCVKRRGGSSEDGGGASCGQSNIQETTTTSAKREMRNDVMLVEWFLKEPVGHPRDAGAGREGNDDESTFYSQNYRWYYNGVSNCFELVVLERTGLVVLFFCICFSGALRAFATDTTSQLDLWRGNK